MSVASVSSAHWKSQIGCCSRRRWRGTSRGAGLRSLLPSPSSVPVSRDLQARLDFLAAVLRNTRIAQTVPLAHRGPVPAPVPPNTIRQRSESDTTDSSSLERAEIWPEDPTGSAFMEPVPLSSDDGSPIWGVAYSSSEAGYSIHERPTPSMNGSYRSSLSSGSDRVWIRVAAARPWQLYALGVEEVESDGEGELESDSEGPIWAG